MNADTLSQQYELVKGQHDTQLAWIKTLALLVSTCVTLAESLNPCEPDILSCEMWIRVGPTSYGCLKTKKINSCKVLEKCLVPRNH